MHFFSCTLQQGAYTPLEKSEVLSGILIQQTPVFIWPGTFDGIHVHDTLALSRSQWGWLYGQFIAASVDTSFLPNPDSGLDIELISLLKGRLY